PGSFIVVLDVAAESTRRSHDTWHATAVHRSESPKRVSLPLYRDAKSGEGGSVPRQDVPVSFSPEHRKYGWREVVRAEDVEIDNPDGDEKFATGDVFFETVMRA